MGESFLLYRDCCRHNFNTKYKLHVYHANLIGLVCFPSSFLALINNSLTIYLCTNSVEPFSVLYSRKKTAGFAHLLCTELCENQTQILLLEDRYVC